MEPEIGPEAVDAARADLVDRLDYDPSEIGVDLVESIEWRDASLGCPAADREYEPGPVPGYRIVLRVGALRFHYHGVRGNPIPELCQFLD